MARHCSSCDARVEPEGVRCPRCRNRFTSLLEERLREYYEQANFSDESEGTYLRFHTFVEKVDDVYDKVERAAARGETVEYNEVREGIFSARIAGILGAISTIEHQDGRGLLTAVVVDGETGISSSGFFRLMEHLGTGPESISDAPLRDQRNAWEQAIENVWDEWADVDPANLG